jgi:PmbA protein
MAVPEQIAEQLLDRARRLTPQAEVFHVQRVDTPVHFEANQVKSIETREMAGAALRIIKDGRVGFGSSTNLGDIDGLVRSAEETSNFGAEARFEFPGTAGYPDVPVEDPAVGEAPLDGMVRLGQSVVEAVRAYSDQVQVEGRVSKSVARITLVNSSGGEFHYTKTTYSLGFEGTVIRGEDMLFTSDFLSSCHPITDGSAVAASIIRQLRQAERTATIASGPLSVVFMPTAIGGALLGPLVSGLSGKTVLQGTSPLMDKLGEPVVDPRFTLTDDPTLPFVPASRLSDDEGVPSRRLALIEGGAPAHFLYDLQTAGQAGTQSTGNGERALGSLPGPGSAVLLIGEGEAATDELLRQVRNGLVLERLLGAGQSNILGGDFNANVLLGYKLEDGEIVGRVKNTMVSGNAYRALNELIAVGSEGRWLGGSLYTPPIACADIGVTSKG